MRKTFKRALSLALAVLTLTSVAAFSASANNGSKSMHTIEAALEYFENDLGETIPKNTYYFYMPEEWKNEYNDFYDATVGLDSCMAGIYWWGTTATPDNYLEFYEKGWPGYAVTKQDAPNVFVADVPADATTIIWNNTVDGGTDKTTPEYEKSYQIGDNGVTSIEGSDSYGFYPNGLASTANMIYVVDPDATETNVLTGKTTYLGSWFYYYGNGEYGIAPTKEEAGEFVYTNGEFPSSKLVIRPDKIDTGIGATVNMTASKAPVTFTVADESVGTVVANDDGTFTFTATGAGETTITFSYTDATTQETETFTVPVSIVTPSLNKDSLELAIGDFDFFIPTGLGDNAVWSSSNEKVVTVDNSGAYEAVGSGSAVITVKQGDTVLECPVTVKSSVAINKSKVSLAAGKTATLKVTGATGKVTWKTSNAKVATVKNGKVTALKKGSATITATADGTKLTCKVTVTSNPKLAKASIQVKKGKTAVVKVTGAASTPKVSKCKVATIKAAKTKLTIKGTKKGSAKVTVTINGVKTNLTVKVK